jgi:hypothetical protein
MSGWLWIHAAALFLAAPPPASMPAGELIVTAANALPVARPGETIELKAADLAPLGETDLAKIRVRDAAGKELLCQALDPEGSETANTVIFQSDFGPGEIRQYTVYSGPKWIYKKEDFKAYGRFARERYDDFAWENDRIAHRMYGKALETWVKEPLTSSTVDIWTKRTPQLVINDWYMVDNYHSDTGTGADFYSAGPSRGCGGNGLWAADRLWTSRNFVQSRVLANGPIRVLFELTYEPFEVNGIKVSEIKRISLDAGQNLDHFISRYMPHGNAGELVSGIGLKKVAGDAREFNADRGWLAKWEKTEKNAGNQGLGVIVNPKLIAGQAEDKLNLLLLARAEDANSISYWAGFCWDKSGQITSFDAWKGYVDGFARNLQSPITLRFTVK